jgi:hypothetical protein
MVRLQQLGQAKVLAVVNGNTKRQVTQQQLELLLLSKMVGAS